MNTYGLGRDHGTGSLQVKIPEKSRKSWSQTGLKMVQNWPKMGPGGSAEGPGGSAEGLRRLRSRFFWKKVDPGVQKLLFVVNKSGSIFF